MPTTRAGDGRKKSRLQQTIFQSGIPQTEEARSADRELIVTTPGLGESISGAILYDETIRQQKKDWTPFLKILIDA